MRDEGKVEHPSPPCRCLPGKMDIFGYQGFMSCKVDLQTFLFELKASPCLQLGLGLGFSFEVEASYFLYLPLFHSPRIVDAMPVQCALIDHHIWCMC